MYITVSCIVNILRNITEVSKKALCNSNHTEIIKTQSNVNNMDWVAQTSIKFKCQLKLN